MKENSNNVNKTWSRLQTTGDKPNIVLNFKLLVGTINREITKLICKKKIPIYTEDSH
jgi:hypothetical protein